MVFNYSDGIMKSKRAFVLQALAEISIQNKSECDSKWNQIDSKLRDRSIPPHHFNSTFYELQRIFESILNPDQQTDISSRWFSSIKSIQLIFYEKCNCYNNRIDNSQWPQY